MEKRIEQLSQQCEQLEVARDNEVSSARSITEDAISNIQVANGTGRGREA